jgi:hypothetical protein
VRANVRGGTYCEADARAPPPPGIPPPPPSVLHGFQPLELHWKAGSKGSPDHCPPTNLVHADVRGPLALRQQADARAVAAALVIGRAERGRALVGEVDEEGAVPRGAVGEGVWLADVGQGGVAEDLRFRVWGF